MRVGITRSWHGRERQALVLGGGKTAQNATFPAIPDLTFCFYAKVARRCQAETISAKARLSDNRDCSPISRAFSGSLNLFYSGDRSVELCRPCPATRTSVPEKSLRLDRMAAFPSILKLKISLDKTAASASVSTEALPVTAICRLSLRCSRMTGEKHFARFRCAKKVHRHQRLGPFH